jgi:4-amino-4-deoxy-L-arabinose transferase-like glycosyltransferase
MRNQIASRLPLLALLAVCVASLAARAAWINLPCHSSCRTRDAHLLIFDERYYVNAARIMAGIRPAEIPGAAYRHAPLGSDPNAEHPQLAKLIMAGSIELLGDGPWGWRLGSLILGTLATLGMFALVRWAGGSPWLGVGAAALMASDNLMLVQGRIATLDIYVVAAMVWSMALYVRGRSLAAGLPGSAADLQPGRL